MVNMQILKGNWEEIKGRLLQRWGRLTNDDLAEFQGDADQLVGLIHRKTGEAHEAVEKYLQDLADNAASTIAAARDSAREFAGRAAKNIQRTAKQTTEHLHTCCAETRRFVCDQPLKTIAIIFGAGIITGLIVALSKHNKECRKL